MLFRYYFDYVTTPFLKVTSSLKVPICSVIPAAIPGIMKLTEYFLDYFYYNNYNYGWGKLDPNFVVFLFLPPSFLYILLERFVRACQVKADKMVTNLPGVVIRDCKKITLENYGFCPPVTRNA